RPDPVRTQRGRRRALGIRLRGFVRERQTNDEFTALAGSTTVRANVAAMQIDQSPHQREPYPETSLGASQRRVHLGEEVEDIVQSLRGNSGAAVENPDHAVLRLPRERDRDRSIRRRVLPGVAQQVADHLLQPERIAIDTDCTRAERLRDAQLLPFDVMLFRLQRGLDDHPEINGPPFELDASSGDARNVEQVVEQSCQGLGWMTNKYCTPRGD